MLPTIINNLIFKYLDTNDKRKMMEYDKSIISYKNLYTLINNFFNIDKQLNILKKKNICSKNICDEIINIFCNTYPSQCNEEILNDTIINNRNKYRQLVIKNNYKYDPEIIYNIDNIYNSNNDVILIFNSINLGLVNIQTITNNVKDKLNILKKILDINDDMKKNDKLKILKKILDVNDDMKKNDILIYLNYSFNNIFCYIKHNIRYVNDIDVLNVYEKMSNKRHCICDIIDIMPDTYRVVKNNFENIFKNYKNIYLLSEINTHNDLHIHTAITQPLLNTILPFNNKSMSYTNIH
jgi:hypothetical protein